MTKNETLQMILYLVKSYPNSSIKDISGTAEAWSDALKNYPADQVMESARNIARKQKFFPSLAELVQNIIPAQYDKLGIPEEEPDQEKLNEKIRKAVDARRHDLGRNLSDEEYREVRDEITKIDEIRRKNTRPFQPPKDVVITDEDIAAQTEYIDLPYMR